MQHFTIYQTTNIVTGQIYIGQHVSTKPFLDTNYYGSCNQLKLDIKTLGRDNFKREVRYHCRNNDELNVVESALVDKVFITRTDTYNKQVGGGYDRSGVIGANKNQSPEWKSAVINSNKNRSPEAIAAISAAIAERNKTPSPEQIAAISKAAKNRSPEAIAAISNAAKIQVACPHCDKTGQRSAMKRWHFDNCKLISK